MTVNKPTELYVWNVENGTAIYVKTPNGKNVVIDCGASDDFSPAECLKDSLAVRIDFLIISHPHKDHIEDLKGIEDILNDVNLFRRNKKITKDLMVKSNVDLKGDEDLERYFDLGKNRTGIDSEDESPRKPKWGAGCVFTYFSNEYPKNGEVGNSTINNLSLVTFIEFEEDVVLYGGDMEESGWEEMLENGRFEALLKKTTIYIASHHGNKSGFSSELFEHLRPKLTIVPAGKKPEYDATDRYREKTKGMNVVTKDGETESRKVLTTRNDDHIHVTLHADTEPTVELGWQPKP